MDATSIPFLQEPVDVLRQGIPSAKADAHASHPLQAKMNEGLAKERGDKLAMLRNVYGTAAPLKLRIEEEILGSVQRLPGLPSSSLGAEALSGKLDDFDFSDALGQSSEESETMPVDMHSVMECRLGLSRNMPARELP